MNFLTNTAINKFEIIEIDIETVYENNNKGSHFRPIVDSFRIYKDFFKFIISSLICAIVDIGLFSIIVNVIEKQLYYAVIISTIFARVVSGILNFILNKKFTFHSNRRTKVQSTRYFLLFICQMLTSAIIVAGLSQIFENATIVKIIIDAILFVISYFIQKRYIFNNKIKK